MIKYFYELLDGLKKLSVKDFKNYLDNSKPFHIDFIIDNFTDTMIDVVLHKQQFDVKDIIKLLVKYPDKLSIVFETQFIDEEFINIYKDKITCSDWELIKFSNEIKLSESFIEQYTDKLNWKNISVNIDLNDDSFIERYKNKINWKTISNIELDEEFIERYINKLDLKIISYRQKLSEEFIERHLDKLTTSFIFNYQKLSEEFIERHLDIVCWCSVSMGQKLSEEFIERHLDKVYWCTILEYQVLSEEFILKLQDSTVFTDHWINNKYLIKYQKLTKRIVDKIPKYYKNQKEYKEIIKVKLANQVKQPNNVHK